MVLLGIDVAAVIGPPPAGISATARCLSSHLSLFAVSNNSVFLSALDEQLSVLQQRVAVLDDVEVSGQSVRACVRACARARCVHVRVHAG